MIVKPLKKKVLVAENKVDQTTEAGIILDGTTSARDSKQGTVLAIGPDVTMVEVGDKVSSNGIKPKSLKLVTHSESLSMRKTLLLLWRNK